MTFGILWRPLPRQPRELARASPNERHGRSREKRAGVKRTSGARAHTRTGAAARAAAAIGGHLAARAAQVRRAQVSRRGRPPLAPAVGSAQEGTNGRGASTQVASAHLRDASFAGLAQSETASHLPGEHLPYCIVPVLVAIALAFACWEPSALGVRVLKHARLSSDDDS
ncbi:hypothetical protein MRX96_039452 [Rhipicephalus microplus]